MAQHPISTISIPEGKEDQKFEVMRENQAGGDWHNRYVRHAESKVSRRIKLQLTDKEILYYCEREPDLAHNDTKLIIHRGGKDGPFIATGDPCPNEKYATDIHFTELKITVPFEHKESTKLYCSIDRLRHWKGKKKENEDDSVAEFHPSVFEGNREVIKVGGLNIGLQGIQDIVVVTALVAQEREEEKKSPVYLSTDLVLIF